MNKIFRFILGAFFMLSSVAKLFSMESFELYIFSFGFTGFDLSSLIARLVIVVEFILGAGMVTGLMFRYVRWMTALSLVLFSLFLGWRAISGDSESCHCMGDLVDMNPLQSLIKNGLLLLVLVYVWKIPEFRHKWNKKIAAATTAICIVAVFIISPPDALYRIGRSSEDISMEKLQPVADSLKYSSGKRILCFYSANCEHCRHCASKMAGIIRRNEIPVDSVSVIFMQTHENQDSVSLRFFEEYGEKLNLSYSVLHPYKFLPMTNGSMPLVVLMDDGTLVKEYDYLSIDERRISGFFNGD